MGTEKRKPLRIPVEEAKKRSEESEVIFLDVVDRDSYENRDVMIAGAVRIDPREIKEEYDQLSKAHQILAY